MVLRQGARKMFALYDSRFERIRPPLYVPQSRLETAQHENLAFTGTAASNLKVGRTAVEIEQSHPPALHASPLGYVESRDFLQSCQHARDKERTEPALTERSCSAP